MQKPSNPKGTRDFGPEELQKRKFILRRIQTVFEQFGFQPIETPAFENLSTLTGKYGEEGDKLLFRILNSGDLIQSIDQEAIEAEDNAAFIRSIAKKGLRYDLTVPFARFVVQNSNTIAFPFRRYQIQPVWRADRPGKGRFQEFTQCDADIIGSKSMQNEADLILIYQQVFQKLNLNAELRLNHRKLLEALIAHFNLQFEVTTFTSTLDKWDKIGEEGLRKEFLDLGVQPDQLDGLFAIIDKAPLNRSLLDSLEVRFNKQSLAMEAITELREILDLCERYIVKLDLKLDLSLARGLDYYTGCIFEAIVPDSGIGSISGGGRYDDLTGVFGLKDVSGVGISFGIDRIYEIMNAQGLFDEQEHQSNCILICHFDQETRSKANDIAQEYRAQDISCFVYPESKKISKQLDYANKRGVSHVIIVGSEEMESGVLSIKEMGSGKNYKCSLQESFKIFKG